MQLIGGSPNDETKQFSGHRAIRSVLNQATQHFIALTKFPLRLFQLTAVYKSWQPPTPGCTFNVLLLAIYGFAEAKISKSTI